MDRKNVRIANIRAFAIILVVLGHSIILYCNWGLMETERSIPYILVLKKFINILEMPLFMSVSGYVFYYSMHKKPKFIPFIWNKFKRILIPYLIVGALWMTPIRMVMNIKGWENGYLENVWKNIILQKNVGHLWYLISLFLIFITLFGLLWSMEKKKFTISMDILVLVLTLFVSMCEKSHIIYTPDIISFKRYLLYLFWFYLGYLMDKYSERLVFEDDYGKRHEKVYLGISSLILFLIFFRMECLDSNCLTYYASALFGMIAVYSCIPAKTNKAVSFIEKNSFGIYLFHSPMIYITFTLFLNMNPYIVVLINVIGLGAISIGLTCLLRKSPLTFVIGE